jgi:DNA-binding beta-propeller fold protein YncE
MARRSAPGPFLIALLVLCAPPARGQANERQKDEEVRGGPAEPDDAAEVRAEIAAVRKLLPAYVDRGAALFYLAAAEMHLGESREALNLLKECMALEEGFDPSVGPEFASLRGEHAFSEMAERAKALFPMVATARTALVTEEKDLIPEGLAWDPKREVVYVGSLNRRKIVQITLGNRANDFLPPQPDSLLPVLGIRLDPSDGTVWADTWEEKPARSRSELVHIDASGRVLARFAAEDGGPHGFNDLVVRKAGDVFTTDSLANRVFRFDPATGKFSPLTLARPLFYPNGIALGDDDRALYVADALGVVRYDAVTRESADVSPGPHSTLSGIDGLYWYRGGLVAVQNGIGSPRVAVFKLSPDGRRVAKTTVLESRTTLTLLPTTGAIRGSDFYFIANSQIDNLNGNKILDATRLEPVRIAVVRLP